MSGNMLWTIYVWRILSILLIFRSMVASSILLAINSGPKTPCRLCRLFLLWPRPPSPYLPVPLPLSLRRKQARLTPESPSLQNWSINAQLVKKMCSRMPRVVKRWSALLSVTQRWPRAKVIENLWQVKLENSTRSCPSTTPSRVGHIWWRRTILSQSLLLCWDLLSLSRVNKPWKQSQWTHWKLTFNMRLTTAWKVFQLVFTQRKNWRGWDEKEESNRKSR